MNISPIGNSLGQTSKISFQKEITIDGLTFDTNEVVGAYEGTDYSDWYKQWVGGTWIYFSDGSRGFVMEQPHVVARKVREG